MQGKISVSRGATLNLGNYESLRLDISYAADFEWKEDEERKLAEGKLSAHCKDFLRRELTAAQEAGGLPPQSVERFTG